jgi:phage tail sheath gpL-like
MVFNATFNNISYRGRQFFGGGQNPEKNTNLSQVTDRLYHIMLYPSECYFTGTFQIKEGSSGS